MRSGREEKLAELQARVEKAVKEYARLASELGMTRKQIAEKLLTETNYTIPDIENGNGDK